MPVFNQKSGNHLNKKKRSRSEKAFSEQLWELAPKANHTTASQAHFPRLTHFRVCISTLSAFLIRGISPDPYFPDPPIPAFFLLLKTRGSPEESKDFPLCRTLKIPGKEGKNRTKKQGKSQNEKSEESEKKGKDWRVRVGLRGIFRIFRVFHVPGSNRCFSKIPPTGLNMNSLRCLGNS